MAENEPVVRPEILTLRRYIPGKPIEEVERELGLPRIVKLASNENPLGPSPLALKAIQAALNKLQLYPDDSTFYLKQALSKHLNVPETQLIIGNGAVEIIRMLMEVSLERKDEVIVGQPSFAVYNEDVKQMGGTLVKVPLDASYQYDLRGIEKAITGKTKMIVLCSPGNPTGTVIDLNQLEAFLKAIPKHILVVLDEAYSDFIEGYDLRKSINHVMKGYSLIVLRTFSKAYGLAGIRVGYGITSTTMADYLNRVRPLFNVNSLAQTAAIAALGDVEHYRATQQLISREKKFFYEELARIGITYLPTQSNFLVLRTGGDDQAVFKSLLSMGVIIRPGTPLGMRGWIRVTLGTHEENLFFMEALKKAYQACQI